MSNLSISAEAALVNFAISLNLAEPGDTLADARACAWACRHEFPGGRRDAFNAAFNAAHWFAGHKVARSAAPRAAVIAAQGDKFGFFEKGYRAACAGWAPVAAL